MEEIRAGLEDGLTTEQVAVYANDLLSADQMGWVVEALGSGYGEDIIGFLTQRTPSGEPRFEGWQMENLLLVIDCFDGVEELESEYEFY